MQYHYVAINIVLFAFVAGSPEPANCGLTTVLCGSVTHTANGNKHHDEEARPHFCCSALLPCSMHRPGYVQGGQEASIGCLLLGVYYRRIPGSTYSISAVGLQLTAAEQPRLK